MGGPGAVLFPGETQAVTLAIAANHSGWDRMGGSVPTPEFLLCWGVILWKPIQPALLPWPAMKPWLIFFSLSESLSEHDIKHLTVPSEESEELCLERSSLPIHTPSGHLPSPGTPWSPAWFYPDCKACFRDLFVRELTDSCREKSGPIQSLQGQNSCDVVTTNCPCYLVEDIALL